MSGNVHQHAALQRGQIRVAQLALDDLAGLGGGLTARGSGRWRRKRKLNICIPPKEPTRAARLDVYHGFASKSGCGPTCRLRPAEG